MYFLRNPKISKLSAHVEELGAKFGDTYLSLSHYSFKLYKIYMAYFYIISTNSSTFDIAVISFQMSDFFNIIGDTCKLA